MGLPKVTICGWCGRSLGLTSDRRLAPGEYAAKILVTTRPCAACSEKYREGGAPHVTGADTAPRDTISGPGKKGR